MTKSFPQGAPEFSMPRGIFEKNAAAMKSAAENDDHARSTAAERLRRREEMRATIIMAAAYKGAAGFRQRRTEILCPGDHLTSPWRGEVGPRRRAGWG
jgi:hypothetical protein